MHSIAADLNCRSGHEANVEIISKVMNIVVHPQRFEILGVGVCSSSTPSVYIINYEVLYLTYFTSEPATQASRPLGAFLRVSINNRL